MRAISIDLESGGFWDESILTAYFGLFLIHESGKWELIDELDLKLKPNDGKYLITPESLTVNHIDLVEHDKVAVTYSEGAQALVQWARQHTKDGEDKIYVLGHGVQGDLDKIWEQLLKRRHWEKFFSYQIRDSGIGGNLLLDAGMYPGRLGKLIHYAQYHKIEFDEKDLHTARGDALVTAGVYEKQVSIVKELISYVRDFAEHGPDTEYRTRAQLIMERADGKR
jgi:hypothetical protein